MLIRTVRRQAGVNQLNLNIRTSQQDWFSLSGQLEIDQDEVMELKTLLDKVRGLEAGEGWKVSASSPFTNSITFDTSVSRLPE